MLPRVEQAGEGRGRAEEPRVARRVGHGAQAAHREPGDRPPPAGAEVALEQAAQLAQVERLPRRRPAPAAVAPVGVEPTAPPSGSTTSTSRSAAEVGDVGRARPAVVGVAAAVQQPEHGPVPSRVRRPSARGEQAHLRGAAPAPATGR